MTPKSVQEQTYEFIFFTLKPGELDAYQKLRVPFKATMRRFKGFQTSEVYQNIDKPLELLDQEVWDSLKDAVEADRHIQQDAYFKIILSPLDKVCSLNTTHLLEEVAREGETAVPGYVELYAYTVAAENETAHHRARQHFFTSFLRLANGFQRVRSFQSWETPATYFNLVYWTDQEAAKSTNQTLQKNIPFLNFMNTIQDCSLRKRYRSLSA